MEAIKLIAIHRYDLVREWPIGSGHIVTCEGFFLFLLLLQYIILYSSSNSKATFTVLSHVCMFEEKRSPSRPWGHDVVPWNILHHKKRRQPTKHLPPWNKCSEQQAAWQTSVENDELATIIYWFLRLSCRGHIYSSIGLWEHQQNSIGHKFIVLELHLSLFLSEKINEIRISLPI